MDQDIDDLIADYVERGGRADEWIHSRHEEIRDRLKPSYNISPTNTVAIVRESAGDDQKRRRHLDAAVWDLRPQWRTQLGKPMINARLETVAEKPMWRSAFSRRRVLVPMRGYFEWTGAPKQRQPHFIHNPQAPLLSAAGLGEVRNTGTENEPEWEVSTAIITTGAVDASGDVHDRMPVFLSEDYWDAWLDPSDVADKADMVGMLHEASQTMSPNMVTYPVSTRVNRAGAGASDPATIERASIPG